MARLRSIPIPLIAFIVVLCCLGVAVAVYWLYPRAPARPLVLISTPRPGEQVPLGQPVSVFSVARDEQKITRIELWVDGKLQDAQSSDLPGGISPFPLMVNWQPPALGTHTLTARAFNSRGGRGFASIQVEAIENADRDNDRVPDNADDCPNQPGSNAAFGCPDRDSDGIRDTFDVCPDQPGLRAGNGCPVSGASDRDGDSVLDGDDACPDQPGLPLAAGCPDGDGDGVRDGADACPREPGVPGRNGCPDPADADGDGIADANDACPREPGRADLAGCPDRDGDGVRDRDDACPDVPGLPALGGCPDRDGDGVRDAIDLCPDVVGPAQNGGCPVEAGDRDGDRVSDNADLCPGEPGLPEHGGCPPPGGGADLNRNGIADDGESPEDPLRGPLVSLGRVSVGLRPDERALTTVEFKALEFLADGLYDEVYCYASLAGGDMERIGPFDPLGMSHWDIAEYLGGANSRRIAIPSDQPLEVRAECFARVFGVNREGLRQAFSHRLGAFVKSHSPSDWDGREIQVTAQSFSVRYRICAVSCEPAALPPPIITHITPDPLGLTLVWTWEGNRSGIRGFRLYVNGSRNAVSIPADKSMFTPTFGVPCGQELRFQMTAFMGDPSPSPEKESPLSNIVTAPGQPCRYRLRIIFDRLRTRDLGSDEDGRTTIGPIRGELWVSGGTAAKERFFTANYLLRSNAEHRFADFAQGSFELALSSLDEMIFLSATIDDIDRNGRLEGLFFGGSTVTLRNVFPAGERVVTGQGPMMDVVVRIEVSDAGP